MSNNHLYGTRDYDKAPATSRQIYCSVAEGSADSWMAHLKRTMSDVEFSAWFNDMQWRHECWDALDDYVNGWRYPNGLTGDRPLKGLEKLKRLLGPERWASGWMPEPIPDYQNWRIAWLQDLWTNKTNFQGKKNNLAGVSPLD